MIWKIQFVRIFINIHSYLQYKNSILPFGMLLNVNVQRVISSPTGKKCTRLSKSDIRVQIVHSDHNATRAGDEEEDVKEPMVNFFLLLRSLRNASKSCRLCSVSRYLS